MQILTMLFTGTAPLYLMSTTYVLVGALLGCPMGGEFKAALQAAWQVHTCWEKGLACELPRDNTDGLVWERTLASSYSCCKPVGFVIDLHWHGSQQAVARRQIPPW